MADLMSDIEYLSREIGPRPAGTEEEQRAALYITDQVNNNTNLTAEIEDITCVSNPELVHTIAFTAALFSVVVSLLFPVAGIPCLIVALLAVAIYLTEDVLDKPILSKLLARDISQNIVAKYQPATSAARGSKRKIIVVANYDSGKVMNEFKPAIANILGTLVFASNVALLASPVVVLFKGVFFPYAGGIFGGLLIILAAVDVILLAIPIIRAAAHTTAAYNEAANCNASGVAVMLEAMRQVSANGDVDIDSQLDSAERKAAAAEAAAEGAVTDDEAVIHGEEAAREEGIFDEGVELEYEDDAVPNVEESQQPMEEEAPAAQPASASSLSDEEYEALSASERLLAAKAAIAGLTGVSVPRNIYSPTILAESDAAEAEEAAVEPAAVEEPMEEAVQEEVAIVEEAQQPSIVAVQQPVDQPQEDDGVPSWFKAAQAKANRSPVARKVNRSRYADALDAASESTAFEEAAAAAAKDEAEAAMRSMHAGIAAVVPVQDSVEEAAGFGFESVDDSGAAISAAFAADSQAVDVKGESENASAPTVAFVQPVSDAPAAEEPVEEPAKEEPPLVIPQYSDNAEMRAAVAAINDQTADRTPIFNREPLADVVPFAAEFDLPFSDTMVADKVRDDAAEDPGRTIAMPPIAFAEVADGAAIAEESAPVDLGRTVAMAPINVELPISAGDTAAIPVIPDQQALRIDIDQEVEIPASCNSGMQLPSLTQEDFADMPNVVVENGTARIVLPEMNASEYAPASMEFAGQRAPLAEATEIDGKAAAKSLLSNRIPKINLNDLSGDLGAPIAAGPVIDPMDKRENLVVNLPSLSGAIAGLGEAQQANKAVSNTGSFAAVGATGAFAPVGDELVAGVAPEDMYIEDADDSVYENDMTETGAFAGPDYVQMPKSRLSKFFSRFGKKKQTDNEISTPQEWLSVDDDFDARTVGRQRGDWSSFRDDSDYYENDDNWRGGAYSRSRTLVDDSDPTEANDIIPNYDVDQPMEEDFQNEGKFAGVKNAGEGAKEKLSSLVGMLPFGNGGGSSRSSRSSRRPARERSAAVRSELREIQEFQAGDYNTEIWFVALGSQMSGEAGMKAFFKEHESELKGSIVVNLEALGAGKLCNVSKEGTLKYTSPSTRLKRFARNASQLSGVPAGTAEITWRSSASSYAASKGVQAISLVGMDGSKPALYGQSDDVVENIDEQTLMENTQYLLAFLRSI